MRLVNAVVSKCVLAYLSLPTVIFMLGWLRWEIGVPAALAVLIAFFISLKGHGLTETLEPLVEPAEKIRLSPFVALALVGCVVVWCIMAGQGGFVPQTEDWHWRNATFRDLISHDWPVRYDTWGRALVFYVGHWLPAAIVGKIAFAVTGNFVIAWRVGNLALLAWTAVGVLIVLAQLLLLVRAFSVRRQVAALFLLVFWGGLDACGAFTLNLKQILSGVAPENSWWNFGDWWSIVFNYTSNSTCLYWVFHQAVTAWVAILFVARGLRLSCAAFVISLLPLCGPLPAIGIAFTASVLAVFRLCRPGGWKAVFWGVLSIPNAVGLFVVAPLVASFLCCNPAAGNFSFAWTVMGTAFFVKRWLLFFGCELGLYFALTFGACRRNIWWWCVLVGLLLCPVVVIDGAPDFCMRASIPLFVMLSVLVFLTVVHYLKERNWKGVALIACLVVGAYVPVKEMKGQLKLLSYTGFGDVVSDTIITFDQDLVAKYRKFGPDTGDLIVSKCNVKSPDDVFFYKHMARRRSADPTQGKDEPQGAKGADNDNIQ